MKKKCIILMQGSAGIPARFWSYISVKPKDVAYFKKDINDYWADCHLDVTKPKEVEAPLDWR